MASGKELLAELSKLLGWGLHSKANALDAAAFKSGLQAAELQLAGVALPLTEVQRKKVSYSQATGCDKFGLDKKQRSDRSKTAIFNQRVKGTWEAKIARGERTREKNMAALSADDRKAKMDAAQEARLKTLGVDGLAAHAAKMAATHKRKRDQPDLKYALGDTCAPETDMVLWQGLPARVGCGKTLADKCPKDWPKERRQPKSRICNMRTPHAFLDLLGKRTFCKTCYGRWNNRAKTLEAE